MLASAFGLGVAGADGRAPWAVRFVDVAAEAGLTHPTVYGGVDRKRFIIEANGAGAAFVDVDADGRLDALVLNGTRLAEGSREDVRWPEGEAPTPRLYRNLGTGRFEDVTKGSGLERVAWWSSVCAGDFDNDGAIDLFLTAYGVNRLFRNTGSGRFEDVTERVGLPVSGERWGSGCTFLDYDRDGRLDLFVANYLVFDRKAAAEPGTGVNCLWRGIPVNCGPKGLPFDTNLLYHQEPDGRFVDVSEASGIAAVKNRYSMTAAAADYDEDGWIDIYVAADSTAAILYHNNHDGTFTDVALKSGAAFSEYGRPQAGMGLGVGDFNNDGRLDLFKTHFADDIPALYRNLGRGLFEDI
ncbi:MAG TPA: VCBS repeat-containing protein, partial [Vicinamibacterales bacterium]|nr:VCBS repeat-containing protein [Vicinamibacterales bacterium]